MYGSEEHTYIKNECGKFACVYFFVEEEKKRLLKELYGIEWKTSDEMNPEWDFI